MNEHLHVLTYLKIDNYNFGTYFFKHSSFLSITVIQYSHLLKFNIYFIQENSISALRVSNNFIPMDGHYITIHTSESYLRNAIMKQKLIFKF